MSTIQGVNQGVKLISANSEGAIDSGVTAFRVFKTYECTMSFAATATIADFGSISGLAATINSRTKNGRSFTITHAMPGPPGQDVSGNAVHITGTITAGVTAGQVDFALGGPTAAAVVAASNGVSLYVKGYES